MTSFRTVRKAALLAGVMLPMGLAARARPRRKSPRDTATARPRST